MNKRNTKVISARVPNDIAELFQKTCKENGETKNQFLSRMITEVNCNTNKQLEINKTSEMSPSIKLLISALGGVGAGTIVHEILDRYLPHDRFTENERKAILGVCAVASGLIAGAGIQNLLKDK